ncbi:hypothetical protein DFH08DRAFT_980300 [Mycena albidolilacea]|uniref:Band 7 domain-containing protein n=1 Tax=Mycena albidolilacea TaxID=1033008 RepID=A0AAD7ATJ9_9AGAR|nr:hypothetical protein DFH08DRAFT_980300 [Mycena albidolilacea]
MSPFELYLSAALVTVLVVLVLHRPKQAQNLPHGPALSSWPVGNRNQVPNMKPWCWFQSLNEQYGPVVYLQMGCTLTIIIVGPTHLNVMEPATGNIIIRSLPNISPEPQKAHGISLGTVIYSVWALILCIHNTSLVDVTFATTLTVRDLPVANLYGPTLTTVLQCVHFPEIELMTTLEFVKTVQVNKCGMMVYAQYGMRNALQLAEAKTALFNTMDHHGQYHDQTNQDANTVFMLYEPPPIWRNEYMSLEVMLPETPGVPVEVKLVSTMGAREAEFVMEQFVSVFAAITTLEPAKIVDLRLLSAAEFKLLESCAEYEPTERAHPFRDGARLEWQDGTVVLYGELNAKADHLAAALIERGVGPEVLAPLRVDKLVALTSLLVYAPLSTRTPHPPALRLHSLVHVHTCCVAKLHPKHDTVAFMLTLVPRFKFPDLSC